MLPFHVVIIFAVTEYNTDITQLTYPVIVVSWEQMKTIGGVSMSGETDFAYLFWNGFGSCETAESGDIFW